MTTVTASGNPERIGATLPALAALTALAFALRVAGFDQSLLGDELFAFAEINGHSLVGVIAAVKDSVEVSPPLYFVLAWASSQIGDPTVWIRLPSLLLGTALVPLTYLLGAWTVHRRAGLTAAALIAVSPFAIFYATEARPYATLAFFGLLATLALLAAVRTGRLWLWVAYAASTAAVIYTHYSGIFVVSAMGIWALTFHRDDLRKIVAANIAAALAFLPWLPQVGGKGQLDVYGPFVLNPDLLRAPSRSLGGHPLLPLSELPGTIPSIIIAAVVAIGLVVTLTSWQRPRPEIWLLVGLALATPAGMLIAAATTGDAMFIARNMSASVPAATVGIAALVCGARGELRWILPIVLVTAAAVGGLRLVSPNWQRADARSAAQHLDQQAGPSAPIVLIAPADSPSYRPLDPYLSREHEILFGDPPGYQRAFSQAEATRRDVFVVYPNLPEITPLVTPPPTHTDTYRLVDEQTYRGFSGGIAIRRFSPK